MDESDDRIARILAEADALLERVREDRDRTNRLLEDSGIDLAKLARVMDRLDPLDRESVKRMVREEQQRADEELERVMASADGGAPARRSIRRNRQLV
ncbi:hypothetical protein ACT80S_14900 [Ramlibacter sp. MAHUQ-53]|uniref:hypothetical protein n=1 Tax=unclassified Ramlibacter TaxID=2617605 RepID=UPI00363E0E17